MSKRSWILVAVLLLALGGVAWQKAWVDPLRPLRSASNRRTVVLIVLDNVRADRLSACGYERPTSPTLSALQGDLNCQVLAPGSWTLPSHASFFTGRSVPEHGAHSVLGGEELGLNTSETVRPLGPEYPTLAEHYAAQGFDTISVSGNPVVSPSSGLTRGFAHARAPGSFGSWYGRDLLRQLQHALGWHSHRDRDLFLFVNIADAHTPWAAVPEGLDWVAPQPGIDWGEDERWLRFFEQALDEEDEAAFLAQLSDVYDYGVFRADDTLGQVLALLEAYGRLDDDTTLLITSDHGEFLGELGLLDHGHYLYEPNNRVFLHASAPLPEGVLSGQVVWDLLAPPQPDRGPPRAAAYPHPQRMEWTEGRAFNETSAVQWSPGGEVLHWSDAEGLRAGHLGDLTLSQGEEDEAFGGFVEAVQTSGVPTGEMDPVLREQLIQAGYLDPE